MDGESSEGSASGVTNDSGAGASGSCAVVLTAVSTANSTTVVDNRSDRFPAKLRMRSILPGPPDGTARRGWPPWREGGPVLPARVASCP